MKKLKKYSISSCFSITDNYLLSVLMFYTLLAIIFFNYLSNSLLLISENVTISIVIFLVSYLSAKNSNNKQLLLLKRILLAPIIFLIYTQVQAYISVINSYTYDSFLIEVDKYIFCGYPTHFLYSISTPLLTEYLQISYMTYFLIPILIGIELHIQGDESKFNYFIGLLIFSFLLSYLLYFIFPAVGPRFTLHEFSNLSKELPGLYITDYLRYLVNFGGGIVDSAKNPELIVYKDCMPSGHTLITSINIIVGFKLNSKFRWVFLILGSSLIFSTVYLRYHYAIDVLVSILLVPVVFVVEPKISSLLIHLLGKKIKK